jgi:hypothetical protein
VQAKDDRSLSEAEPALRARAGQADSKDPLPADEHPQRAHTGQADPADRVPTDEHPLPAHTGQADPEDRTPTDKHPQRRHTGQADPEDRTPTDKHPQRRHTGQADPEDRPLLLVDIDGVISLFAFEEGPPTEGSFHSIDGIFHFLSSAAAEHLLRLAPMFEVAWASGWEEKANEYLPHLLDLPKLPHLSFERRVGRTNAHWKLDAIDAFAGERPLAWIDDAFNDACHRWAEVREAPTLLVQTMPASGLTGREAEILERWALTLAPA